MRMKGICLGKISGFVDSTHKDISIKRDWIEHHRLNPNHYYGYFIKDDILIYHTPRYDISKEPDLVFDMDEPLWYGIEEYIKYSKDEIRELIFKHYNAEECDDVDF